MDRIEAIRYLGDQCIDANRAAENPLSSSEECASKYVEALWALGVTSSDIEHACILQLEVIDLEEEALNVLKEGENK